MPALPMAVRLAEPRPPTRSRSSRGIAPTILLTWVHHSAPYLFGSATDAWSACIPYIRILRERYECQDASLNHCAYFELCLAAHHATVASYSPTDVDHQIRYKLWQGISSAELEQMGSIVEASQSWDTRAVSTRWLSTAESDSWDDVLSGHQGEWLSTAAGAYGAFRARGSQCAIFWRDLICAEVRREAEIFRQLWRRATGSHPQPAYQNRQIWLDLLRASTMIAHNLGDLDRVLNQWGLGLEDTPHEPIHAALAEAGHGPRSPGITPLGAAGHLNTTLMAVENHRHFALRKPRCLRKSAELLLPTAPFLDDWGGKLSRHPEISCTEIGEVVQALIEGFERLNIGTESVGYARALSGIVAQFPGGLRGLGPHVAVRLIRSLKTGKLRRALDLTQEQFEEAWKASAQKRLSELRYAEEKIYL